MQFSMFPQSGTQVQQEIVVNKVDGLEIGPIMKCKYFRIQAVTNQNILFNWALIYAPSLCGVKVAAPGTSASLVEPQQFVIASGTYLGSAATGGACTPLKAWSPLARNLNPGDGIFLVVTASTTSSTPIVWNVSFMTCVN